MFVDGSCNAAYRHHSFQFDLNTENCSLLNALKKSLHLSRRKTCFAHPVLENFFFVYRGVSFETANRSSIPSNSFMRDNSNIPLPIAVLQQFLGLFSMRSTRLKIVFMFMPDILKYTPFRFFESHTYHGRKKESRAKSHGSPDRVFGFTSPAPAKCAAPAPSKVSSCNPKSSPCARSTWSDRIHAGSAAVQGHLRESYGSHRGRFLNRHA